MPGCKFSADAANAIAVVAGAFAAGGGAVAGGAADANGCVDASGDAAVDNAANTGALAVRWRGVDVSSARDCGFGEERELDVLMRLVGEVCDNLVRATSVLGSAVLQDGHKTWFSLCCQLLIWVAMCCVRHALQTLAAYAQDNVGVC